MCEVSGLWLSTWDEAEESEPPLVSLRAGEASRPESITDMLQRDQGAPFLSSGETPTLARRVFVAWLSLPPPGMKTRALPCQPRRQVWELRIAEGGALLSCCADPVPGTSQCSPTRLRGCRVSLRSTWRSVPGCSFKEKTWKYCNNILLV